MVTAKIAEFLASVGFQADEKSLKTSLLKVAGFAVAVKLATVGVYAALTRVATGEMEIARKAEQLGTTTERLRELGYIAEQTGGSMDAVTSTMENLVSKNPRIRDAAKALDVVAARMRRLNEQQQKAYARRMGIDPTLIPALTRDVSALKDEFRAMYAVAGTDGKAAAEASRSFLAEIGKLSTVAGMLARSVAMAFLGKIRKDVEHLRRVIMENFGKIKRVLELVIAVVLRIAAVIGAMGYRIIKWVSALVGWFDGLDDGQRKVVAGAAALLAAWKLLNLGFLATPIGALIAGLLAIVALVDDYQTYMEGGISRIDWGAPALEKAVNVLRKFVAIVMGVGKGILVGAIPAIEILVEQFLWMMRLIGQIGQMIFQVFTGDFAGAIETAKEALADLAATGERIMEIMCDAILAFFTELWASVMETFPDFGAMAKGVLDDVSDFFGFGGDSPQAPPASRGAPANQVLMPSPAAQTQMAAAHNNSVQLSAKTDIHISTTDPIAAGNQAAAKQADVNAEMVRNTKARMR